MKHLICVLLAFMMTAATGCMAPPLPRKTPFDPSEYAWSTRSGTGSLTGQAFVTTVGGDVKYAAGKTISLNPVTSYSTEWYNRRILNNENLEVADPRATELTRSAMADGEGRFKFKDLPAGDYYVTVYIGWMVPWYGYGSSGMSQTGACAHAKVTIREGQTTEVIATH